MQRQSDRHAETGASQNDSSFSGALCQGFTGKAAVQHSGKKLTAVVKNDKEGLHFKLYINI